MQKNTFSRIIVILVLLFILPSYKEPKYCQLIDKIINKFSKELQKEYGLKLGGYGGGMMDDIKIVGGSYQSRKRVGVDEARRIYVHIIEGSLDRINADEAVRPYLHNYPFTTDNLEFRLGFIDEKHKLMSDGYVSLVFICRNDIYYESYDHEAGKFYDLYSEPYEEAVAIVKQQQAACEN